MARFLLILFMQLGAAHASVTSLTLQVEGTQWGAFTRLVQDRDGPATVTLEDGWIDRGFLALWWPDRMQADGGKLALGQHRFDPGACDGRRVDVQQVLAPGQRGRVRSWTLMGACAIACEVETSDEGRLQLKSLTLRIEGIAAAL